MQIKPSNSTKHLTFITSLIGAIALAACDPEVENLESDVGDRTDEIETNLPVSQDTENLTPMGFDVERQMYLYDRDGDSYPDITEEIEGTDMFDPNSKPGPSELEITQMAQESGFPTVSCRPGFRQAGPRLCISTNTQNRTQYRYATSNCRNQLSHVCTHEDLDYLYINSTLDATYNPIDRVWLENYVGDDIVLCGNASITANNDPDIANFEGHCNKAESRPYWCCHDDEQ